MNKRLARLRYKTDRELFILAERQLEQTLGLAQIGRIDDAAHAYEFAKRLIAVANLPHGQRARVENLLARVEAALNIEDPIAAVA